MNDYASKNGLQGRVKLKIVNNVGHNFGKLAEVCQISIMKDIDSYLVNERQRIEMLETH
jgi:hypothetical protein